MFSRKFNTGSLPIPIPIFCFIFYWWSRSRLCNTAPYATECTVYGATVPCLTRVLVPARDGSFSSSSLSSCFPAPSVSRIFGPPGNKMTQISALAFQQFLIYFFLLTTMLWIHIRVQYILYILNSRVGIFTNFEVAVILVCSLREGQQCAGAAGSQLRLDCNAGEPT